MIYEFKEDFCAMRSSFWDVEIDIARPRITTIRADAQGLQNYSENILYLGEGGETIIELVDGQVLRSATVPDTRRSVKTVS
jgi:hypothetical protein